MLNRNYILAATAFLLQACIFVPKTTEMYDAGCQIVTRQMELETREISSLGNCRGNQECVGLLVMLGAVSAGSAVVSGSIVVVGKMVYWFEKQGRCVRET